TGTGRAPHRTGAGERTRASSPHAARTAAPAHHRPASSSRSAHLHPAHAPRGVRISRTDGGDQPPQTQRIRVNTGRARSATSRYSPKILSQPVRALLTWLNAIAYLRPSISAKG